MDFLYPQTASYQTVAIFSQVYSLYFLLFLLIYGGLGSYIGFWGEDFQLMVFGACGVGASGFFGLGFSIQT